MRIALDGMGGDLAPQEAVLGGANAARDLGVEVVLVGLPERVQPLLETHPELHFVPASQVIEMDEHPAQAVRRKPDSSMSVCARLAKQGKVDGWVSAGNSGGIMAAALFGQGRIRGVERPALGTVLPTAGQPAFLLDVGANVDSRPEYLVQFARMGCAYVKQILGRPEPRVGLLSNGEEAGKGDQLVRETQPRLAASGLNFCGNVEPKEVLAGRVDVVVADGFAGSLVIKTAEATAELIFRSLREEIPRSVAGKAGGLLIRGGVRRLRRDLDWREYGGAPLLGINGVAVVAHGRSDALAIKNAIRVAKQAAETDLTGQIQSAVGAPEKGRRASE
ncbi:MAG: phosphate acyltransferase PlsX [Candidatus Dormibacter sp.]|uniref:phosphate acyltransferase PlsX n=1 Tax=Candidatus Dormibacter sp. TaxID=2973982 RepID=UPI000DB380E4|nr:MAG: phosphate acyltransferase PlsX [Candidatus Dormibacteraeota bacterium]